MDQIILTIGYIPNDWSGASDGSSTIMVADSDHSGTRECEYIITDDAFTNPATGKVLSGDMASTYKEIGNDSASLSNGSFRLKTYLIKNIYEVCLEETGDLDSDIVLFEEGISQFENKKKKFNGSFYVRYISEADDEIVKELLFVMKSKC
jgi:hypothetical protein